MREPVGFEYEMAQLTQTLALLDRGIPIETVLFMTGLYRNKAIASELAYLYHMRKTLRADSWNAVLFL
jgi:hypothetical protein